MMWDAMDLYLPWKFFITESLKDGYLPLWNFSINGGFPQMGDPGTWYPVSWVIAWLMNGYSIMSVNVEYLLHLFIASVGMFLYVQHHVKHTLVSVVVACSYMFSGLFIANAQHIGWIVGAAWLPWILYFFKLWLNNVRFASFPLALVLFLQLSGGYPAIFFITAYILLFQFAYHLWEHKKDIKLLQSWQKITVLLLVFCALSFLVIYASFDMAQHINRGKNIVDVSGKWNFLVGSLNYQSFLTFVIPLASLKEIDTFWQLDSSMISVFIGFFIVLSVLSQLVVKKINKKVLLYTLIALFFYGCALGYDLPLRKWIAYLPLMDMFRFPSLFRLFGGFFLLIAAAHALLAIINNKQAIKQYIFWLWGVVLIFGALLVVYIVHIERWRFLDLFKNGYLNFLNNVGFNELVTLQLIILFLLTLVLLVISYFKKEWFFKALLVVCMIDVISVAWMQRYGTVMSDKTIEFASQGLEKSPQHYPIPELKPMEMFANSVYQPSFKYLWRNLPIFSKKPSNDGTSPYTLVNQQVAAQKGYDTIFNRLPLFLISQTLNLVEFSQTINEIGNLEIKHVDPNCFVVELNSNNKGFLVFNHNYYPHWNAKIDGNAAPIKKIDENYMAVPITKGKHLVQLTFEPPFATFGWYLLLIGLVITFVGTGIFVVLKLKKV